MSQLVARAFLFLEPAIAILFFGYWSVTQAGAHQLEVGTRSSTVVWYAALLAVAFVIGASRLLPRVAGVTLVILLLCQLLVPRLQFNGTDWPIYFGILVAVFTFEAQLRSPWRRPGLVLTILSAALVAWLLVAGATVSRYWPSNQTHLPGAFGSPANVAAVFVAVIGLALGAWFLGAGSRAWQQKVRGETLLAQARQDVARANRELDLVTERERIAQDVHDVMAHSLAVIIAQADGARFLVDQRPEAVANSLEHIAHSARRSLTEVRMLIESLVAEPDRHPSPGLQDVPELVSTLRSVNLNVLLTEFGQPSELSKLQEIAVYRIVQESLTNAVKHAGANAEARVVLDWRSPGLALSIHSHGEQGNVPVQTFGSGRGVTGMQERARVAGGWLSAGSDEEDGYLVTCYIPPLAPAEVGVTV
ncbi:sensor histidine kinase [Leifsonia sp. P73]|uniref:sensor histidine kinase n=1 Tax=Leifsonia sp. P73 TaxID=3423959 RepID=UPI003DA4CB8E